MCRSCHTPAPDPEAPLADCAFCHEPARAPESLTPLLPGGSASLDLAFDDSVPPGLRAPFEEELRRCCGEAGLDLVPAGTPGAGAVAVTLSLDAGPGWTGAGVRFHGARGRAVVSLGRVRVPVEGGHAAGAEAADVEREAILSLAARVARCISL